MVLKKKRRPIGFGGFSGFDDFFSEDFDDVFRSVFENMRDLEPGELKQGEPAVYGFSMRVGPDGKPRVEEFGNVQKGKVTQEREPLVDVINEAREIRVIAELPGVDKLQIKITARPHELGIKVDNPERRFAKTLKLPEPVLEKTARASYKNGILEVVLQKAVPTKAEKGQAVKVD